MKEFTETINILSKIDFLGKGESFVESKFLTPLLECLGYDQHKDYEVIRHGDDGSSFKLTHPPVESGAIKSKNYNPDYIPTIRKKMFWIIEAKSPKDVNFPFEYQYIVQGLQYCVHPEIQAKYLVLSNGIFTSIYDPQMSIFFENDVYEPIFVFQNSEIPTKWEIIFKYLSVETIRDIIEDDLRKMYEKLSLSSLDKNYPQKLWLKIGENKNTLSHQIDKHVSTLYVDEIDRPYNENQKYLSELNHDSLYSMMDLPLCRGKVEARHYIDKVLGVMSDSNIFDKLTTDYEGQSIFRKEQTYVALCELHSKISDSKLKDKILLFLNNNKDKELNLLNQVECTLLRVTRKILIINAYPSLRESIKEFIKSAPEMIKYVNKPSSLKETIGFELLLHERSFHLIKNIPEKDLLDLRDSLESFEMLLEKEFNQAIQKLASDESQIGGYEGYGYQRKHWRFKIIVEKLIK